MFTITQSTDLMPALLMGQCWWHCHSEQVVGVIFMTVKMCLHAMFCWHPCNLCSCCQHCRGCFPKLCCQHCPNIAISSVPFSSQDNQLLTFQYLIQSTSKKPFRESFVLDWVKMSTNINQIPIKTQKLQKMQFPPFIWANIRNLTCYGVLLSESKAAQMGLLERLNSGSSKGWGVTILWFHKKSFFFTNDGFPNGEFAHDFVQFIVSTFYIALAANEWQDGV